jgi:hypothetical protein
MAAPMPDPTWRPTQIADGSRRSVHKPQQREQDAVHQPIDSQHQAEKPHRQPVLQPLEGLLQVRFGDQVRQNVLDQRLRLRRGSSPLDPRGFERFGISEGVDGRGALEA